MSKSRIIIPRDVLLVEIERRCPDPECNAKTRVGLTKEEARAYRSFACGRCEQTWDDVLTERDVPDWWEELTITGLHALRESRTGAAGEEPCEIVARMSDDYRRVKNRG